MSGVIYFQRKSNSSMSSALQQTFSVICDHKTCMIMSFLFAHYLTFYGAMSRTTRFVWPRICTPCGCTEGDIDSSYFSIAAGNSENNLENYSSSRLTLLLE